MKKVVKRKKLIIAIAVIICSITVTGCWDQKIYEKVGFILEVGVESSKNINKKLLVTYTLPAIGLGKKNQVELISEEADLLRQAREEARTKASRPLEAGKTQQILISKELAEKGGINNLLEVFTRDALNPALSFVVIVDGSPNELLERARNFQDKPRTALYINQLLESGVQDSKIPETRVYNFDTEYFAEGLDAIVPMIKLETSSVKVVGLALLSDDRMVGQINKKQATLLLAMMNKMKKAAQYNLSVPNLEEGEGIAKRGIGISIRKSKRDISVDINDNKPVVNIKLKFKGVVDEYKWDNLDKKNEVEKIEKEISRELEKECLKIMQYTQFIGSDPLGIGDIVRAKHNSYWNKVKWKDTYKAAYINVDVEFEITGNGLTY